MIYQMVKEKFQNAEQRSQRKKGLVQKVRKKKKVVKKRKKVEPRKVITKGIEIHITNKINAEKRARGVRRRTRKPMGKSAVHPFHTQTMQTNLDGRPVKYNLQTGRVIQPQSVEDPRPRPQFIKEMMGGQKQESLIKEQKKQELKRREIRVEPPIPPTEEQRARSTPLPIQPSIVQGRILPPRQLPTIEEEFAREKLSRGYALPRKQVRDQASQEERARVVRPKMRTTGVGEYRVSGEEIQVGGDVGRRPSLRETLRIRRASTPSPIGRSRTPSPERPLTGVVRHTEERARERQRRQDEEYQSRIRRAGEEAMRSSRPVSSTTSAEHGISQKTSVASQGSGEGAMREAPSLIVPFGE